MAPFSPRYAPGEGQGMRVLNMAQHSKYQPWIVCFSAALFFFYEFIQLNMFNAINSDLMRDFAINATQLGKLSAIYFYANLLFLPIAGSLLDRYSPRKLILITLTLCVFGIGLFALSYTLIVAGIARFISGIGSAFCFLSSIRIASHWFPSTRMALVSGLIVTMAMTGGMIAQTPLTYLVSLLGWRQALLIDSLLGVFFIFVVWRFVQDYPANRAVQDFLPHERLPLLQSWKEAYLCLQNWCGGIYTSLMNLPMALFGAIWGSLYLEQAQQLSRMQASIVITFLFLGAIIGGPVMGALSDFLSRRKIPMLLGALFSLADILVIIYSDHFSLLIYMLLFFLLGFFTSTQVISYPFIAESNAKRITATAVSAISLCAVGGYAVFQPLFGMLMDKHWNGVIQEGVHIYAAQNYHDALLIMPIGFAVALLAVLLMRESYGQTTTFSKSTEETDL